MVISGRREGGDARTHNPLTGIYKGMFWRMHAFINLKTFVRMQNLAFVHTYTFRMKPTLSFTHEAQEKKQKLSWLNPYRICTFLPKRKSAKTKLYLLIRRRRRIFIYNHQWNVFSAFNPSKCTHMEPTLRRPGSSWGFGALLKGSLLYLKSSFRLSKIKTQGVKEAQQFVTDGRSISAEIRWAFCKILWAQIVQWPVVMTNLILCKQSRHQFRQSRSVSMTFSEPHLPEQTLQPAITLTAAIISTTKLTRLKKSSSVLNAREYANPTA